MHLLKKGDTLRVSNPQNNFALIPTDDEVVLLAGGIGITPIASMAAELRAQGKRFRLVYAARNRIGLAFFQELTRLCSPTLCVHCDDEGGMYDLRALMVSLETQPLYLCGPTALIDAAMALAKELGWQEGRLRFELFSAAAPSEGDTAFDVILSRSGKRVHVRADQAILDALTDAGETPNCDCRCGDCGLCQVGVIDGIPDHRDYYLSEKEKSSNKFIQICVSRSKTSELTLDI